MKISTMFLFFVPFPTLEVEELGKDLFFVTQESGGMDNHQARAFSIASSDHAV